MQEKNIIKLCFFYPHCQIGTIPYRR